MENISIRMTPKDFFLHLGVVAGLYVSSISLLALLFQIINSAFPDALESYRDPYSSGIRFAIASLIIIYPSFIFLSWLLNRDYEKTPPKRELGIRKWLVYFTLFVAGIAVVIDLIILINTFLSGEVTVRFILKVIAVLVVAGFIFGYYLSDLKQKTPRSRNKVVAIIVSIIVLASIVSGFVIMGSPGSQRDRRLDEYRVNHLQSIQSEVIYYWQRKEKLPATLGDLEDPVRGFMMPNDPETDAAYEYEILAPESFRLCATFKTDSTATGKVPQPSGPYYGNETWSHGTGRVCFDRPIDKDLFPPRK
ncbi:MAG TPA: DUF5671 domain-containing protein [Candidatus Paceibacterota bacterium]